MLTREQMAALAAGELQSGQTVHLGAGLAQLVAQQLPQGVVLRSADATPDVAVVVAQEVSASGELVTGDELHGAKRVVALLETHEAGDGSVCIRKQLRASASGRTDRIITNMAVFDSTAEGLVMRQVAQGVSAHDVQLKCEAPLLAADDLRVIDL